MEQASATKSVATALRKSIKDIEGMTKARLLTGSCGGDG